MRRDDPSQKYPAPVFSQRMKRIKKLMKAFRYAKAEAELIRMKMTGFDPARQKEIIYTLARAQYKEEKGWRRKDIRKIPIALSDK